MTLLARPVDAAWPVTQPFGAAAQVYTDMGYKGHPGPDFGCDKGTPVSTCDDGTITWAALAGSAGLMVSIRHSHGVTRYLHLSSLAEWAYVGNSVPRGAFIGFSGGVPGEYGAGLTTGPHLHLDYYPNGEPVDNGYGGRVDPLPYMEGIEEAHVAEPTIVDALNLIWARLTTIQQAGPDVDVVRIAELAEEAKQQGVVEIKKRIGLQ